MAAPYMFSVVSSAVVELAHKASQFWAHLLWNLSPAPGPRQRYLVGQPSRFGGLMGPFCEAQCMSSCSAPGWVGCEQAQAVCLFEDSYSSW